MTCYWTVPVDNGLVTALGHWRLSWLRDDCELRPTCLASYVCKCPGKWLVFIELGNESKTFISFVSLEIRELVCFSLFVYSFGYGNRYFHDYSCTDLIILYESDSYQIECTTPLYFTL